MIASVHAAQLGVKATLGSLLRRPSTADVPGLRWIDAAVMTPLAATRPPTFRHAVLFAFWDDEEAATRFAETHPVAQRFGADRGFHATLRPLRAFGTWPGLDPDVPTSRTGVEHDGPVIVFTLGRLRISQAVRFLRASRPAEKSALDSDDMVWGSASARPPFVATVSMWASGRAAATYAYGRQRPQHSEAIAAQQRKDFHRQSAFIRFAPISTRGTFPLSDPRRSGERTTADE